LLPLFVNIFSTFCKYEGYFNLNVYQHRIYDYSTIVLISMRYKLTKSQTREKYFLRTYLDALATFPDSNHSVKRVSSLFLVRAKGTSF